MTSQTRHVPYRICLLGEHVDHQGGETLSGNLGLGVSLRSRAIERRLIRIRSADFAGTCTVPLDAPRARTGDWCDYIAGIAAELGRVAPLRRGVAGRIRGEFQAGGLSSSAAVQIAYALALLEANGRTISRHDLARSIVAAERDYIGVAVGPLDPMTILFADALDLLHLEARTLSYDLVEWPSSRPSPRLAIIDPGVRRTLRESPYNDRIAECARAAAALAPGTRRLLDVPPDRRDLARIEDPVARARATHVYGEVERVRRGTDAWRAGDLVAFGALVNACGESCETNFDLGTPEVTTLARLLRATSGVTGARFCGGGFGGAVFALLPPGDDDPVTPVLRHDYARVHPAAARAARLTITSFGRRARAGGVLT